MAAPFRSRTDPTGFLCCEVKDDLAHRIEGHIEARACGRIRDLHVVCVANLVIVQGSSPTYHVKQVALEAVMTMAAPDSIVTDQIVVGSR